MIALLDEQRYRNRLVEHSATSIHARGSARGGATKVGDFYTIEISLRDVNPRIWRPFMIRMDATFIELHEAIQDACGWHNSHLF